MSVKKSLMSSREASSDFSEKAENLLGAKFGAAFFFSATFLLGKRKVAKLLAERKSK